MRWSGKLLLGALLPMAAAAAPPRGLDPYDAVAEAPPRASRRFVPQADPRLRTGAPVHMEERLGLPSFLWAAPERDAARRRAVTQLRPEHAARQHLATYADAYLLTPSDAQAAELAELHDTGRGPIVARFRQWVRGVPVFRDEVRVVMDRDLQLVALSGYLSPDAAAAAQRPLAFNLDARVAISAALSDLRGSGLAAGEIDSGRAAEGGYLSFQPLATTGLSVPPRARQVLFHLPDRLEPGWYLELGLGDRSVSVMYSYVISAVDGRLLFRNDLIAQDAYTYRVWADGTPLHQPFEGPQGHALPHPTPDQSQPGFIPPTLLTWQNAPFTRNDPWLPPGATTTSGNNADAYADLASPDGFSSGDLRATTTSPGSFDRTYDVTQAPDASPDQRMAAITQLFFNVNFFHDWYYDSGFNEQAGNAQMDNYGRGGIGNDPLRAEAQDYNGLNNANMATPSDGASPRMQMFIFRMDPRVHLDVISPPAVAGSLPAGTAQFGPQTFDVTGTLALAAPADACSPIASVAGKIALIDRGNCSFVQKVKTAQTAGAVGVLVANNQPGLVRMAGTDATITIPSLFIELSAGDALKAQLAAPVTVRMAEVLPAGPARDGALDNQIVAHEWGHYISNRLIDDANGLATKMSRGLGEGWADFHALLITAREGDLPADFSGAYSVGDYASFAETDDNFYFGVRRVPYSTDRTKDPLTFKHIADGVPLPGGVPIAFTGTNSEVHNTGEIWTTMLWECYAALLRDTGRFTFTQARDRMKDTLVAAYKITPANPTLLEARDAILAAAHDAQDHALFVQAFARRGAGTRAVAPDRYSLDNNPVVESFDGGNDVAIVSVAADDSTTSLCGANGRLDAGETGKLTVTIKNVGIGILSSTTATVSSSSADVSFPSGTTISFAATAPLATASGSIPIRLAAGAAGLQSVTFTVTVQDPALTATAEAALGAVSVLRLNYDDVPNQSATDDVESPTTAWTATGDPTSEPGGEFRRITVSATDHRWFVPDLPLGSDQRLMSPPLHVSAGSDFIFSFKHRFDLSTAVLNNQPVNVDAGVLELSTDDGATWIDVGASATPGYTGTVVNLGGAPLDGRSAFVGTSPGYPNRETTTVNLGRNYAGRIVRVRFRAVTLGVPKWGWEIDDIAFQGIADLPFHALVGRAGSACNRPPVANAGAAQSVLEGTTAALDGRGSSDPDGDALSFRWVQQAGPAVVLSDPASPTPSFTAPKIHLNTTLTFALFVSDGRLSSAPATVNVAEQHDNHPPVANAGIDQSVSQGARVTLDGSGSADPDGDPLTYKWTVLSGPSVTLDSAQVQKPSFVAGGSGTTVFQLIVNDGTADSAPAQVKVSVRGSGGGGCSSAGGDALGALVAPLLLLGFARSKRRPWRARSAGGWAVPASRR